MAILYSGNGNPTSEQEKTPMFIFMFRPAWIRSAGQSLLYRYTVVLDITPTQTEGTKYITSVVVNDFDVTNSSTSLTPNGYDYVYDAYGHISGLSMWFEASRALTTTALRQTTPGGTYQRTITTVPYDKYDLAFMGDTPLKIENRNSTKLSKYLSITGYGYRNGGSIVSFNNYMDGCYLDIYNSAPSDVVITYSMYFDAWNSNSGISGSTSGTLSTGSNRIILDTGEDSIDVPGSDGGADINIECSSPNWQDFDGYRGDST